MLYVVRPAIVAIVFALPPSFASAQSRSAAETSRPPTILDSAPDFRIRALVQLRVAHIEQALQSADSVAMQSALGSAETPYAELATARRRGCQSMGWMLAEAKNARSANAARPVRRLDGTRVAIRGLSLMGTDSARAELRVTDGRSLADVRLDFRRQGDELILARAPGLYAAICSIATRRPDQ